MAMIMVRLVSGGIGSWQSSLEDDVDVSNVGEVAVESSEESASALVSRTRRLLLIAKVAWGCETIVLGWR